MKPWADFECPKCGYKTKQRATEVAHTCPKNHAKRVILKEKSA